MKERDLIRCALYDAIGWQEGLMDAYAHMKGDPGYRDAEKRARMYRNLLRRRYGSEETPQEAAFAGAKYVTISDLSKKD